jgi:protein TonB
LLLEALLLLVLLSLGFENPPGSDEKAITVVNLELNEVLHEAPERQSLESVEPAEQTAEPQRPSPEEQRPSEPAEPLPPIPAEPPPQQPARQVQTPAPPALVPVPPEQSVPAAAPTNPVRPAPTGRPLYGPPDRGGSSSGDTERVGTAPNGEPLYAASWYRRPRDDEMRGYMSTASGPGWGLIACRTAPNYRVEDCVALDEYPEGSRINRAALAASWVFQVQPPSRGGRSLVGSWVRIRIDYGTTRR